MRVLILTEKKRKKFHSIKDFFARVDWKLIWQKGFGQVVCGPLWDWETLIVKERNKLESTKGRRRREVK